MPEKFASEQPKHGDSMIHCGHMESDDHHFFKLKEGPVRFRRPDMTYGEAYWVIVCQRCFQESGGDPTKVQIRGDGVWQGDEPAVTIPGE